MKTGGKSGPANRNDIVIGASGMVGSRLREVLGVGCVGTCFQRPAEGLVALDIRDADAVHAFFTRHLPGIVHVPAADPNVDSCERNPGETRRLNVEATRALLSQILERGGMPVFYSTDYLFDGKAGPYSEDAPIHPLSEYGRQKAEVEAFLRAAAPTESLVIRTASVYGVEARGKNFLYTLHRVLTSGGEMRVATDQVSNPTYAPDLAEKSAWAARNGVRGVLHVAGRDFVSRHELALRGARALGLPTDRIRGLPTAELGQIASRPLCGGLKTDRMERELRLPSQPLDTGLAAFTQRFRQEAGGP